MDERKKGKKENRSHQALSIHLSLLSLSLAFFSQNEGNDKKIIKAANKPVSREKLPEENKCCHEHMTKERADVILCL